MARIPRFVLFFLFFLCLAAVFARAQQTLGAINGTVADSSGAVVQGADVRAHNTATGLEQSTKTKSDGSFSIVDLPIGSYEVTFSRDGFKKEVHSQILVQGNRTTTVNATLQPGEVTAEITVTSTPLMNQTDTTNGYVVDTLTIEDTPLGTGSFTQLAILSPGGPRRLSGGRGVERWFRQSGDFR
ncbi:MAG TPA: carboxypeptidase-like regulatory domain-containing protein [Candidatus Acidoferrum sp.]